MGKGVEEHRMAAAQVISLSRGGSARDSSDDPCLISDEELVAAAKKGQRTAFDELHNRHAPKMFRVAHRITRNREDAEDAVQECFLKAFVHLKAFDGRAKFLTWLTRIAMNAAQLIRLYPSVRMKPWTTRGWQLPSSCNTPSRPKSASAISPGRLSARRTVIEAAAPKSQ